MKLALQNPPPLLIPKHTYGRDREYDIRSEITPQVAEGALRGVDTHQYWVVFRPLVMPLMTEHIYPTHGQFADWEMGTNPNPQFMQQDHPGGLTPNRIRGV